MTSGAVNALSENASVEAERELLRIGEGGYALPLQLPPSFERDERRTSLEVRRKKRKLQNSNWHLTLVG